MADATAQEPPQVRISGRRRLLYEVLLVGLGYLVYSQVRGLAGDRVGDAFANARWIIDLERELGIFEELAFQALVLPNETLVDLFNLIYFYGLFPLLIPTAIFLYLRRPVVYVLVRNAFLTSGAIAVVFFLLVPTAPPRLLPGLGFIDTLSRSFTPTYDSIPGVNHFAAVPSMHVGWNFLMAVALYTAFERWRFRGLFFILPVSMYVSTVVTGNHYFVDGPFGIGVAAAGLGVAVVINRLTRRSVQKSLPQTATS